MKYENGDKMKSEENSMSMYERARRVIPAGVTRPFRFFEPYPFYVKKAYKNKVIDLENKEYIDFWMGHGALVLGHMHQAIVKAVKDQIEYGFHFGLCNEWEVKLAEQIVKLVPSVEMVRFTNSGTEANMHAIRLARAYTKRLKIGKFEGNFHGIYEPLYVGMEGPNKEIESAGIDPLSIENTIILPFNDLEAAKIIKKENLACVIIEPIMGGESIPADIEFLKEIKEACNETGTLLIFDEVITGFRISPGGAQEVFGIIPDLTTFGKAVGGGEFPVGAFGGKREIMDLMDHLKHPNKKEFVMQGGTYSGNPLVMRAGYYATKEYEKRSLYEHINNLGNKLKKGLEEIVEKIGKGYVSGFGSMIKLYFTKEKVKDIRTINKAKNKEIEKKYFHYLISKGIIAMTPSEVHFYISLPHSEDDIEKLIEVSEEFLKNV
jgi:glutamate-1-semialdehyde 2,1-aminomutase